MPRGQKSKTHSSTTRCMRYHHCQYCGRIFTFKNKRLACKIVDMHSKKCNGNIPPKKNIVLKNEKIKKHMKNIKGSLAVSAVGMNVTFME